MTTRHRPIADGGTLQRIGLADLLGGCPRTLTGWHVPDRRRYIIDGLRKFTGDRDQDTGLYRFVHQTSDSSPGWSGYWCLCGWRPSEEAMGALEDMRHLEDELRRTFRNRRDNTTG